MKLTPGLLLFFLATQAGFILYGVALVLWTVNEWDAGEGLNAIFGGFLGALTFLIVWRALRRWVRRRFRLGVREL